MLSGWCISRSEGSKTNALGWSKEWESLGSWFHSLGICSFRVNECMLDELLLRGPWVNSIHDSKIERFFFLRHKLFMTTEWEFCNLDNEHDWVLDALVIQIFCYPHTELRFRLKFQGSTPAVGNKHKNFPLSLINEVNIVLVIIY